MQTRRLQDAKNHLGEVIRDGQPQIITLRGKEEAVVLSFDEYRKLLGGIAWRSAGGSA